VPKFLGKCLFHEDGAGLAHAQSRDMLIVRVGGAMVRNRVELGGEWHHHMHEPFGGCCKGGDVYLDDYGHQECAHMPPSCEIFRNEIVMFFDEEVNSDRKHLTKLREDWSK